MNGNSPVGLLPETEGKVDPTNLSAKSPTAPTVVACYSVFDAIFTSCGFNDLTEGMYEGNPGRPYSLAQARQAQVLLDRAGCGIGSRLLDIGCGYGRIISAAANRGAKAWGITVSPEQVRQCKRDGLDVRLKNYKHLGTEWNGQFDQVVANGSLEHFAQASDAAQGHDSDIYRHLFETVHRVIDPISGSGRFVTTAIHFSGRPDPRDHMKPETHFPLGSDQYHFSRLTGAFGGWYPTPGQLESCAKGFFKLVDEEDGTEDYRLTSEAWLEGVRAKLRSLGAIRVCMNALSVGIRRPMATYRLLSSVLGSESWNWQFRGEKPPTRLLRHTWQRID